MKKNEKTNYLRFDHRYKSLSMIIQGLTETIDILENQINEIHWYDNLWFMEESESIYGLAFIAFQNYINGSIKDFSGSLSKKQHFYKYEQNYRKSSKSKIELIIGLANYIKHKDEGRLNKGTEGVLDYFNINCNNITTHDKSPIFQGLTILNEDWNLYKIKAFVTEWRENLWTSSYLK